MFLAFLKKALVPGSCTRCHSSHFNRVKYQTKPDFYPPKLCNAGKNYTDLNMKKLSFETMRDAVKLSFDNVKTGCWTTKNAEYYL